MLLAVGFQCESQSVVSDVLGQRYNQEVRISEASPDGKWAMTQWENRITGTWTVTAKDASGLMCVIASGKFERA
jgi:hypothetical protein